MPIALVAVLALAAFISAGLWLTPGGQTAQAQGIPDVKTELPATPDDSCDVIVNGPMATANAPDDNLGELVSGGGCIVNGDTVDVTFKNISDAPIGIKQSLRCT